MEKQQVELRSAIHAPIDKVWRAITVPNQIQSWFSPTTPWVVTSLEPGGRIYAVGYESEAGIIQTVNPPHVFEYRWDSPPTDQQKVFTITTYRLHEEKGATEVIFTEFVSDTLPEPQRQQRIRDTRDGYKKGIENLQAYLEGTELPHPEGL